MPQCPSCLSGRIFIRVDSTREAFCAECGARWRQEGGTQTNLRRPLATGSLGTRDPVTSGSIEVQGQRA